MKAVFAMDGKEYAVSVTSLRRRAEVRDGGNVGTAMSGRRLRDILGTYYSYTMELAARELSVSEYDSLYEELTAPVDSHMIRMPYGQSVIEFEAYIEEVDDVLKAMRETRNLWGEMEITFSSMVPLRIPEEET